MAACEMIDTRDLESWLATIARVTLSPEEIVAGLIEWCVAKQVPIWRLRLGQSIANPLVSAWDIVWTRGQGLPRLAEVRRELLRTGAWAGSPFQFVVQNRQPFRRRLRELDSHDHPVLHEIQNAGGTDYLALPLNYGNGVTQAVSIVSDAVEGFSAEHVTILERLFPFVGAALEPHAMRRATSSLLATYIGRGPATEVEAGAILRGARRTIHAAILFADLRSFTATSASVEEEELLALLNDFFEAIVVGVQAHGGDVLKFIGDAVLAIFPVDALGDPARACLGAEEAVYEALKVFAVKRPASAFVAALHSARYRTEILAAPTVWISLLLDPQPTSRADLNSSQRKAAMWRFAPPNSPGIGQGNGPKSLTSNCAALMRQSVFMRSTCMRPRVSNSTG